MKAITIMYGHILALPSLTTSRGKEDITEISCPKTGAMLPSAVTMFQVISTGHTVMGAVRP